MCGRYTVRNWHALDAELKRLLKIPAPIAEPRYNIAPSQTLPIVAADDAGQARVLPMRWGFVPSWDKAEKPKMAPINARGEDAFAKPMFRPAIQERRCLIPADGFYEWKKLPGDRRQPFAIRLKSDRPFFFAGIYERATAQRPETYLLFTTTPNSLMEQIHNRMPAMLTGEMARAWLQPGEIAVERMLEFMQPYPAAEMDAVPVSSFVNNPRNDTPDCIASVSAEPTPTREPDLFG